MRALDEAMLQRSVSLGKAHLEHCRVFPNRRAMLQSFPRDAVAAEVGVATGDFSADILEFVEPKKLYLIDAWEMKGHPNYGPEGHSKTRRRFANEIESGQVKMLRGLSWEMLGSLDDHSLDWVYIDAAHDFESVRRDLEVAKKKLAPDGIISGHDYTRWGKRGRRFGVLEAVNRFCIENSYELLAITLENDYNWSYALKFSGSFRPGSALDVRGYS